MSTVRWPSAPVLAHPADGGGERLGQDAARLNISAGVLVDLVDGGALVAAVEEAQEVAAVLAVEGQQRGALGERLGDEAQPLVGGQAAGGQPRVRRHHVRGDERVLEVEGGEVAVGRRAPGSRSRSCAGRAGAAAGRRSRTRAVLDDRRQVDLGDVAVPVDRRGGRSRTSAWSSGVERVPAARAAGRRRRPPRTRRRRRRARRSRGPARPPPACSSTAALTARPACPAAGRC